MSNTIPTRAESLRLFKEYVLLSNVERHCVSVATTGVYLAQKYNRANNANLNLDIVFATSLFHDLAKASQISLLEPEKYHFTPFTPEQESKWQILRKISLSLEDLYKDLNVLYPNLNKKIHETDVASIIISGAFPDFISYVHQIGGTRNEIYFTGGWEIKIMHYADWILHVTNLVPFETRLEFLFAKYWQDLPEDQKQVRITKEKALETELFKNLDITPDLNLSELNQLKHDLFNGEYDFFEIGKTGQID